MLEIDQQVRAGLGSIQNILYLLLGCDKERERKFWQGGRLRAKPASLPQWSSWSDFFQIYALGHGEQGARST